MSDRLREFVELNGSYGRCPRCGARIWQESYCAFECACCGYREGVAEEKPPEWLSKGRIYWLCRRYNETLAQTAVGVKKADTGVKYPTPYVRLDHIRWMLNEMSNIEELDKLNRWLGFVQGALWCGGVYTIDEMREHVREALQ